MGELIYLKKSIVTKIKDDAVLYGKVAQALGISAPSLRPLLKANHIKLTQIGVLLAISDHLYPDFPEYNVVNIVNLINYKSKTENEKIS